MQKVKTFLRDFFNGMRVEYQDAWEAHPATIFWTGLIAFFLGAILL